MAFAEIHCGRKQRNYQKQNNTNKFATTVRPARRQETEQHTITKNKHVLGRVRAVAR